MSTRDMGGAQFAATGHFLFNASNSIKILQEEDSSELSGDFMTSKAAEMTQIELEL